MPRDERQNLNKKKTRQVSVIWHLMYFFILLIIDKKAKDDLHPLKNTKARRYHLTFFLTIFSST